MAITNAQQYQQLVNKPANGKRPGYRGSSYGPPSRSSSQGPAGGASSGGNYGGNTNNSSSNNKSSTNQGPAGGASAGGNYGGNVNIKQEYGGKAYEDQSYATQESIDNAKKREEVKRFQESLENDRKRRARNRRRLEEAKLKKKNLFNKLGYIQRTKDANLEDLGVIDSQGLTIGGVEIPNFISGIQSAFTIDPSTKYFDEDSIREIGGVLSKSKTGITKSQADTLKDLRQDIQFEDRVLSPDPDDVVSRSEFTDYVNRNKVELPKERDERPEEITDPCKGPNPPAYCFVNNDDDQDPKQVLTPRILGSYFDPTFFAADGGRARFQEGGIMPRLNQLGSGVSSAEQMLQGINQRLESAESSLGEGGGGIQQPLGNQGQGDPFFGKGELKPIQLAGGATQQPAFGSMEEAYSSFQDKAKEIREGGMLGRVVLPGEMSFKDFSNNMNLNTGLFGMHGAGGVPAGGNNMQSPLQQAVGMADGGIMNADIVGGFADNSMDEMGRQMYGLGKLVKKATRGIKKLVKSPVGKAALIGAGFGFAGMGPFKGLAGSKFGLGLKDFMAFGNVDKAFNIGGKGFKLGQFLADNPYKTIAGLSFLAPLLAGKTDEEKDEFLKNYYAQKLDPATTKRQMGSEFDFYNYNLAEGGMPSKEPVAKKTMPLLDMGGKEKDYRETGGFVDMGRMERADDVPARLSKNEFVFTADAVRNAGDGNIDKGAEVMYNMMKNLEAGGDVSEESQGLEGARRMFQTSQRLGEVL